MRRVLHGVNQLAAVAADIQQRAGRTDVYVGVLPRRRPGGGRDDLVSEGGVVWVDCDTADAVDALRGFAPPPSIVVRSGTGENRHAYWLLSHHETLDTIERANRQLAGALGADMASGDAARILRPAPGWSHKRHPPAAVGLEQCNPKLRYRVLDIVGDLADPREQRSPCPGREGPPAHGIADPLLALAPGEYVERLAGVAVPRHGKVHCPFHHDRNPSLHVYRDPERGWYCYGCQRGGSIYEFAALLRGVTTRGADFAQLRDELCVLFATEPPDL